MSKTDQFDFLIDIVPREELPFPTGRAAVQSSTVKRPVASGSAAIAIKEEQVILSVEPSPNVLRIWQAPLPLPAGEERSPMASASRPSVYDEVEYNYM